MKYYIKKYYKYILIISVSILIFITMYFYNSNDKEDSVVETSIKKTTIKKEKQKNSNKTIFVDVKGAVNKPGVYELETGKRVMDAINLAGGITKDANTININLSKKVTDEMYIIVYTAKEIYNYKKSNGDTNNIVCASNECDCPDSNNDACIKKENSKSNTNNVKDKTDKKINGKVSINTASKEELMTLSGIGEAKANKIIEYRQTNGNFNSLEDIKNVSGIGDALYNKIKDNISL